MIGNTFEGRRIFAFVLGKSIAFEPFFKKKEPVLIIGAHIGKDLLTVQMCVKIFLEELRRIIFWKETDRYLLNIKYIFVPIINVDAHLLISKSFGSSNWLNFSEKIKNMNPEYCKEMDAVLQGVNLSKNYLQKDIGEKDELE